MSAAGRAAMADVVISDTFSLNATRTAGLELGGQTTEIGGAVWKSGTDLFSSGGEHTGYSTATTLLGGDSANGYLTIPSTGRTLYACLRVYG
jgi:hypothetical protein